MKMNEEGLVEYEGRVEEEKSGYSGVRKLGDGRRRVCMGGGV